MKHFFTFLILGIFFHQNLLAQETIPEPEFSERPYYLINGEFKNLERADATLDVKVKGMGYGGSEHFYTAFGEESPVRFDIDNLPRIFIKLDLEVDPEETIDIVRKDKKNKRNRRRFKQGSRSLGGKTRDVSENKVVFSTKKIRNGLYEIIFDQGLKAGEYAIMPITKQSVSVFDAGSSTVKITCFGIDQTGIDQTGIEQGNNIKTEENKKPKKEYPNREAESYAGLNFGLAPFFQESYTSESPFFSFSYEHGINDKLGIGGVLGYGSRTGINSDNSTGKYLGFGFALSYYFFNNDILSFYTKGGLGIWDRLSSSTNGIRPLIHLGTRISIKEPIGVKVELGYGLSVLTFGLYYAIK